MKYACTYELSLSKIIITKANMGRQCGNIVHLILKFYKNKPFNIVISFFKIEFMCNAFILTSFD